MVLPIILSLSLDVFIFLHLYQRFRFRLPPGPRPWPVVGNLHDIKPVRFRCFAGWAQSFGPIICVWFGSTLNVVVSNSELAKEALKEKDQQLADRHRNRSSARFSRDGQDLIWADYGPHYVKVRKVCTVELFSLKRLEAMRNIREDEVTAMVKSIYIDSTFPGSSGVFRKNTLQQSPNNIIKRNDDIEGYNDFEGDDDNEEGDDDIEEDDDDIKEVDDLEGDEAMKEVENFGKIVEFSNYDRLRNEGQNDKELRMIPLQSSCGSFTDGVNLYIGQEFLNKNDVKLELNKIAVRGSFELCVTKSSKSIYDVRCLEMNYKWRIRAARVPNSDCFSIRTYCNTHTCDLLNHNRRNRQATSNLVAKMLVNNFR